MRLRRALAALGIAVAALASSLVAPPAVHADGSCYTIYVGSEAVTICP